MKNIKNLSAVILLYIIVLGVNLAVNFPYYMAGGDWHYSVLFSLSVTTLGWLGYWVLSTFVFRNILNISAKTAGRFIFLTLLVCCIYGVLLMVISMKAMVYLFHFPDQSAGEYVNNSVYAALFTMLAGLIVNGKKYFTKWKQEVQENEHIKQEMMRSQYEVLKNQVNPHFLFNALNTLTTIIPEQPALAVDFVEQLARVFRYSLQYADNNTVLVDTELNVVSSFLFLNKQRFNHKLITHINISENARQRYIITQALLMVTENVLKHNELSAQKPLSLWIYDEDKYLIVKNTLQRMSIPEASNNIGINNIINRYRLVTDIPVIVTEDKDSFTVKLPLL